MCSSDLRTQLADTSSSGPMRAMLASAGVATTDATFDAAAASAAAAAISTSKRAMAVDPTAPQDRFDANGAWLNPDDSNWWEKVDVAGATVPKDKPLTITPMIKIKKTATGALKISNTAISTAGGWDACLASAQSIDAETGGAVSTAALTMYADGVGDVGGSCFVPPAGGGGL